jgi:hypothetical protein
MLAYLHYDLKSRDTPEVQEAMARARNAFGDKLRLECFDYRPAANAADEAREGGPLSLSCCCGLLRGLNQIRQVFPLPA